MDDEDQNSILYQAIQQEMFPQVDPVAMWKYTNPGDPYRTGVEIMMPPRGGPRGGLGSAQQPTDFAGRPAHANTNPARVQTDSALGYNEVPMRPSGNVINQYQPHWEQNKSYNNAKRVIDELKYIDANPSPSMAQRTLRYMREFFNANRSPDWWKNF